MWRIIGNPFNNSSDSLRNYLKTFDIKLGQALSTEECNFVENHYDVFIGAVNCNKTKVFTYLNVQSTARDSLDEEMYLHYNISIDKAFNFGNGTSGRITVKKESLPSRNNRVLSPHSPEWFLLNVRNPKTVDYLIKEANNTQKLYSTDGLFIDGLVYEKQSMQYFQLDNTFEYSGILEDYIPEYLKDQYKLMDSLRIYVQLAIMETTMLDIFKSKDLQIIVNATHPWYLESEFINRTLLINNFDWFLLENGIRYPYMKVEDFVQLNNIMWLTEKEKDKKLMIQGINNLGTTNKGNMFLLSAYYLIQNENTYFSLRSEQNELGGLEWMKAIEFDIGKPIDQYPVEIGDGTFYRKYDNGIVVVRFMNEICNYTVNVNLQREASILQIDGTLEDKTYTEINMRINDGFVLVYR